MIVDRALREPNFFLSLWMMLDAPALPPKYDSTESISQLQSLVISQFRGFDLPVPQLINHTIFWELDERKEEKRIGKVNVFY